MDELIQYYFVVVVVSVFETCKGTDTDDVTITAHYRDSLQQVFWFITIHDDATFSFQLPCALINIEYDNIHSQIQGRFLCA